MMKKWPFILALISIFIAVNIFLIEKKNSKVDRLHFVSNWEKIRQEHFIQSFNSNGVILPSETHYFYVDKDAGFNQFLVKEGDSVKAGTPLFEYSTANIEKQKSLLETEIARLEKDIDSIESHIKNLSTLLTSAKQDEQDQAKKDKKNKKVAATPKTVSYSIEMQINEKELEKEKLEQQLEQYQAQQSNYDNDLKDLTIVSNTSGIVKNISYDLNNPVLTIVSNTPVIQGYLSEEQLTKVKNGMRTISTSKLINGQLIGVIERISTSPKDEAGVEKKSIYPYIITLDKYNKKLNEGYHVETQIITKEITDAAVIKKNSILTDDKQSYVWVIDKGTLVKKPIQLGLHEGEKTQIKNGASPGELYIVDPNRINHSGPFITPLMVNDISKNTTKKVGYKSIIKYITIGILQR
ncbi:transporter [Heyndrickxia sporothermodurans]|nr:transporter [Heyndrickxia sporothermodurans]